MMTHLKNKCIQERKLDKDLFGFPIDVHTFYHETDVIDKQTLMYVSSDSGDLTPEYKFSIYNPQNFNIVRQFLPQILDNDQVSKLEQHVSNGTKGIITCSELNIDSMFHDIDHFILNAFVTNHFKNVRWLLPCFPYAFVLQDIPSIEEAVRCIESVHHLFHVSLSNVSSIWRKTWKITSCMWVEDVNREILIDIPLRFINIQRMSNDLGFTKHDVETLIRKFETKLALKHYDTTTTCYDEDLTVCGLAMLRDVLKGMLALTN
jgi:hypothetical protein